MFASRINRLAIKSIQRSLMARTLGTSPTTINKVEIDHIPDMSIHGLTLSSVTKAAKNMIEGIKSSNQKESPLGRWKVETDNFSKSYAYDHTA